MRKLLGQHPSICLSFLCVILSSGFFFLHDYFFYHFPHYLPALLLLVTLTSAALAVIVGNIIYKLNNRAYTDPLTKLWNRRYFNLRLQEEVLRMARTNAAFGIALIDIDYFKDINDRYGHAAGDQLLITIAGILQQATRNIDIVTRWGGDEFAIIFPNTVADSLTLVSDRIKTAVIHHDKCYTTTVSIGMVSIDASMNTEQILELVDAKLYEDKKRKASKPTGSWACKTN